MCQFQVYSKVLQLHNYIYLFFFQFFYFGYIILSRVPCASQWVLIITFKYLEIFCSRLFKKYLFICFWLYWVFIAVCRLPPVVVSGGYSLVSMCRLLITVVSLAEHRLQGSQASAVVAYRLLPHRMWNLPTPGIEPIYFLR